MSAVSFDDVEISRLGKSEALPYDLLLLADPSREIIDTYLGASDVYVARWNNEIIGVYVLFPLDQTAVEIKAIAVAAGHQGKGLGGRLLRHADDMARQRGFRKIVIGTANASVGQIYLYQKQGFELTELRKNFFLDLYSEPIFENGIQCKHMLVFRKELRNEASLTETNHGNP